MTARRPRPNRRVAVGLLVAFFAVILVLGAHTIGLYQDLQRAQLALTDPGHQSERSGFSITRQQADQVLDRLAEADTALTRASGELEENPLLRALAIVPPVARQLDAASALVRATRALTGARAALGMALDGFIATRDENAGKDRIAAFARLAGRLCPQVEELATAFAEADTIVSGVDADGLMGPLAQARGVMTERLDQLRPLIATAETATSVLPSIMGVGGQRRYLMLALDNAEIRPIGGLIAAFATPTFNDGSPGKVAFQDIFAIDRLDQTTYVQPPDPLSDHLLGDFTWQVADAGWWPDFAKSAQEARRLYGIETGDENLQGVIAFTPELVDRLLAIVGPVTIDSAGITVRPGETYLVSLEQVEVLNKGEGRKAFLADLAQQVLQRLYALPPDRYVDVLAALDEAGKRMQLQVQFDDPDAQAAVDDLGWPGPFTFPASGDRLAIMEANVAPVSKLDVLLSLDHSLDVRLSADGSADERLVTIYTNHYGPDLSPELERVRSTFIDGIMGSYNRRYLVPDAEVTSVTSDDPNAPVTDPDSEELESGSLAVGNYQFVRPGTVRLTTEYVSPNVVVPAIAGSAQGGIYQLSYRKQAGRDRDTLTVRVTVPAGMTPTTWSDGGVLAGDTVIFTVTSEFDHTFEVAFGPA